MKLKYQSASWVAPLPGGASVFTYPFLEDTWRANMALPHTVDVSTLDARRVGRSAQKRAVLREAEGGGRREGTGPPLLFPRWINGSFRSHKRELKRYSFGPLEKLPIKLSRSICMPKSNED